MCKRKGQETRPELHVSGMKSQGWVSGCPVSGRPPRGLTPTCSKGRCHSPAVLMKGHLAPLYSWVCCSPLWVPCGPCRCPGETVVCRADAHAGSCSFTSLVLCSLFFFCQHASTSQKQAPPWLRFLKGFLQESLWGEANRNSHGYSLLLGTSLSSCPGAEVPWRLCWAWEGRED